MMHADALNRNSVPAGLEITGYKRRRLGARRSVAGRAIKADSNDPTERKTYIRDQALFR